MIYYLLILAAILLVCTFMSGISHKVGIPALFVFLALGMVFGFAKEFAIEGNMFSNANMICSIALIFIMFYGGFGTNWKAARSVAVKSVMLSTVGVVATALITGLFCLFVLHMPMIESFLIGSVLSCTDAATVFAILRSRNLNLKFNTASLLEVESGSNDPMAYTMTAIFVSLLGGSTSVGSIIYLIFSQIVFGIGIGFGLAFVLVFLSRRFKRINSGYYMIFMIAAALLAYAIPSTIGGNGYLSVYIVGIILGNSKLRDTVETVHFFDGITSFMQVIIFFLLGMLSTPQDFPRVFVPALLIAVFMTVIARPVSVFAIMGPFGSHKRQMALVSVAGLRGASSIVFAITAAMAFNGESDLFNIVFLIVLFSMLLQGSLLPFFARKFDMIDTTGNVAMTFNDYMEDAPVQFIQFEVPNNHKWAGIALKNITFPPETLVVLINRNGIEIQPNGDTVVEEGDKVVLSAKATEEIEGLELREIVVTEKSKMNGAYLYEIYGDIDSIVIMIMRGSKVIIPHGNVKLQEDDILVVSDINDSNRNLREIQEKENQTMKSNIT